MKLKIVFVIFFASVAVVQADEAIAQAQQALKDQGFYYGEVTGEKNTDTTSAIRRYQIRNGLQVTGNLDTETLRLLGGNSSAAPQPAPKIAPLRSPSASDENAREPETEPQAPVQPFDNAPHNNRVVRPQVEPFSNAPQDRQVYPSNPATVVPPAEGLFAGTPYQTAPPEVQRDVVASAQRILAGRDLYRGEIDGIFGPGTEFSLRAYQSRVGLPLTGRLDLETLAGLELLPGARRPVFTPRWRVIRPRPEPPVRGEWVRP
jgi:peptidoglycan hydrolase-like protein with peptidoglycan-binding domain